MCKHAPGSARHFILLGLLYTALFLLLTKYSAAFAMASGVMVWYAPAGLNIAMLMIFGLRCAPLIALAGLLGGVWILAPDAPLIPLIIVALTTPAVETFAVFLLKKWIGCQWRQWNTREFCIFIGVMTITPVFTAMAGIANYCLFGMIPWSAFSGVLLGWWTGDVIGILTVTPVLLFAVYPAVQFLRRKDLSAFLAMRKRRPGLAGYSEVIHISGQIVAVFIALWFCFHSPFSSDYTLFYLCFLPLIWIVFTRGLPGATIGVSALNAGAAFFAATSLEFTETTNLQFFMMMLSLTGLLFGKLLSDRKMTEAALRESEEKLRDVTNKIPGMVYRFVLYPDGSFAFPFVSEQIYKYSGNPPERVMADASSLFQSVHPDDIKLVQRAIEKSAKTQNDYHIDHRMIGRGGKIRWLDVRSSPKQKPNGDIVWSGVATDITERKEAERQLKLEREQLLSIFDSIPAIIDVVDPETYDLLFLNNYALQLLGKDALGKKCHQAFHDFESPCEFCTNERLLNAPDQDCHWEYYSKKLKRHFMTTNKIIQWPDGRDVKFELSFDITERKQTEEAYHTLVDNSLQALAIYQDDRIVFGNAMLARMTGYELDELYAMKTDGLNRLISKEDQERLWRDLRNRLAGEPVPPSQEFRVTRKDGGMIWVQNFAVLTTYRGRPAVQVAYIDITERKRVEQALKQSEQRYRTVADFTYDWEYWEGADGSLLYVSPSCERITGYRADDFMKNPELLTSIVHPDDRPMVADRFHQAKNSREKLISLDFRIITQNGEKRWISHCCQAVFSDEGFYLGRRGSNRDVTQRKQAEQQLIQADKMASLGLLSAGVAHEINNPVNLILLNASLLKDIWRDFLPVLEASAADDPRKTYGGLKMDYLRTKLPELLDNTHLAARRIESTVANLKNFSKRSDPRRKAPIHINAAVENAVKLSESTLRKSKINLSLDLGDDLPKIDGNIQNIEQIVINLIINGIQAFDGKEGEISIRTTYNKADGRTALYVTDAGKGVDPSVSEKIFDPFVTTRQAEGGIGLGLSIVYNLVKFHDGDIDFQSEPGKGATFRVRFPTRAAEAAFGI